ncbi:saccharopine dehydrogenase NADP-binding domain-containing protein [Variovorax dokdonensis]|uniref:Saccharopine dehydrogenase NADP-binding domain-containing protein n=1 Tax=Variovorax dokdonensis TaxID=344883 RepID=A0ABT7NDP4_9BURK|nr:saccharopine dehydrogenase NADP-binding domain-containing protein [Variovorax dokdonensis]MDM0045950.1 saccharopine dehydrogenase NADP-binding domain-containing protein [Variovorax dokdonensis]
MTSKRRILLYGATGYSGRLIAQEAARQMRHGASSMEVVLAARDRLRLRALAERLGLEWRAFGLDEEREVADALRGFDVVINAAGPFSATGERLAKSAISVHCHYVDIGGEVDVYKRMDDLGYVANSRDVTIVCGAGHTSALSDLMLDAALEKLDKRAKVPQGIGAVRIAVDRMKYLSRGSARTMLRMVREQVTVARANAEKTKLLIQHAPIGKIERSFNFGGSGAHEKQAPMPRIATAANMIDTLSARNTLRRRGVNADSVESYIEMSGSLRMTYQVASTVAAAYQLPMLRELTQWQVDALPEGPTDEERRDNQHRVVLQIENAWRKPMIDACLKTGDPYELTARLVLAVACGVNDAPRGWQTPAAVLSPIHAMVGAADGPLAGCEWLRPLQPL